MLYLPHITIQVGNECNLKCAYCFKDETRGRKHTFTSQFKEYLTNFGTVTKSVCITGGEPLLYLDTCKQVFSYIPSNVYKTILTNGTLITDAFVEYVNSNDIKVKLSYDGENTVYCRGTDVLADKTLLQRIRRIKHLDINSVINKVTLDTNIVAYTQQLLQRTDYLHCFTLDISSPLSILDELLKYHISFYAPQAHVIDKYRTSYTPQFLYPYAIVTTLDGSLYTITYKQKIGTVFDDLRTINQNYAKIDTYCKASLCSVYEKCKLHRIPSCSEKQCEYYRKLLTNKLHIINVK